MTRCCVFPQGVVHAVLDKLVARLEALLARKQFNQLGGLQARHEVLAFKPMLIYVYGLRLLAEAFDVCATCS